MTIDNTSSELQIQRVFKMFEGYYLKFKWLNFIEYYVGIY